MKTPVYILMQDYNLDTPSAVWSVVQGSKIVPAGTFVKLIEKKYVPKHVLDRVENTVIYPGEVFGYCSLGIYKFPMKLLRKDE